MRFRVQLSVGIATTSLALAVGIGCSSDPTPAGTPDAGSGGSAGSAGTGGAAGSAGSGGSAGSAGSGGAAGSAGSGGSAGSAGSGGSAGTGGSGGSGGADAGDAGDGGLQVDSGIFDGCSDLTVEDHTAAGDARTVTWAFPPTLQHQCMKIKKGQSVKWHTPADFNTHPLQPFGGTTPSPITLTQNANQDVTFAFPNAGVYGFDCAIHGQLLEGAIYVQ